MIGGRRAGSASGDVGTPKNDLLIAEDAKSYYTNGVADSSPTAARLKANVRPCHADYEPWELHGSIQSEARSPHFAGRLLAMTLRASAVRWRWPTADSLLAEIDQAALFLLNDMQLKFSLEIYVKKQAVATVARPGIRAREGRRNPAPDAHR